MKNKCLNRVENIVRKGEIACYKQLIPQCFPQLRIFSAQNATLRGNELMNTAITNCLIILEMQYMASSYTVIIEDMQKSDSGFVYGVFLHVPP